MSDRLPSSTDSGGGAPQAKSLGDGRYLLVRKLAEGGTAQVYLGYDTWSEEWRAVKTLLPEYTARPALRHRFEIEARTMKDLDHPNIIEVYDAGVDGENAFMVMEYAEGGSIIDWVDQYGPMPALMACRCIEQLCAGIQAAHEDGIIHRDVKPQNLLVARDGTCKVTDFGIAQVVQDTRMTMTGTVMGTIGYMAPEQHESAKHTDERADVYSIAATLYTLAKGEAATHLFMADDRDFVGLPAPLAALIRRGAQYRRDARHATVADFITELRSTMEQLDPVPPETPSLVKTDILRLDAVTPPMFPVRAPNSLAPTPRIKSPTLEAPVVRIDSPERSTGGDEYSEITPSSVLPRAALTTGAAVPRRVFTSSAASRQRRLVIRGVIAGGISMTGIAAIAVIILAMVGSTRLERAMGNMEHEQADLFDAVEDQHQLVLDALDAFPTRDAEKVEALFEEFHGSSDPERRLTTIRSILARLEQEKRYIDQRMTANESPAKVSIQRQVTSTLRNLTTEMEQFENEQQMLEDAEGALVGQVATFFNLP